MYKSWERIAQREHAQVRNHVQCMGGGGEWQSRVVGLKGGSVGGWVIHVP